MEIMKSSWPGAVREVTLGATAADGGSRSHTLTVGGENGLPFLHFESNMPHAPAIAVEINDRYPYDWSPLLIEAWGEDVVSDVQRWARTAEQDGADLLQLSLSAVDADGESATAQNAVDVVQRVLEVSTLPLLVYGPGQAEIDNELLVAVADATRGERIVLGLCEDKNYRTIVAAAMANGHLVTARSPMDVNLAKQLNILINDMKMPLDRILMDPTTGALGYGIEYGYSAMERLRLAALQGDAMMQLPMIVTPGYEAWKTKEAKVGDDVPTSWGDWRRRAVNWETLTATTLLQAGADILILRHPESVRRVRATIAALMPATTPAPAA
jgi:acetyl-CoA decarbonylase/synthase, CODH/ACS complex subunit delta